MARISQRKRIEALVEKHAPSIQEAFLAAVDDIVDRAELGRIIDRLTAGDIEGAIAALHLDAAAFAQMSEAIRTAYIDGGNSAMATVPATQGPNGGRLVFRFDGRSPRAEAWLQEVSSQKITRIAQDQVNMVREIMTEGLASGDNPRKTALDVIGRVNRATGKRQGGVVGLTGPQGRFVSNAREELHNLDSGYFTRQRRDRRFDSAVAKAIREKKPLSGEMIERVVGRYSDRLLHLRGETIARTEALAALNASHMEAFRHAAEAGQVDPRNVTKTWVSTRDKRTRDKHRRMNGETVAVDAPYSNGLMHPCDPNGSGEEVINCRCTQIIQVDFLAGLT